MTYYINNKEVRIVSTEYDDEMVMVLEAAYIDSNLSLTDADLLDLEYKYQAELLQDANEGIRTESQAARCARRR